MPPPDLDVLLVQQIFQEQTPEESAIIRDWLAARGAGYDEIVFAVRVGRGVTPDSSFLPGVQRMVKFNSRVRADVMARRGSHWTLVKPKTRLTPSVLGQLRTYELLWLEDHPDAEDVGKLAIGRFVSPDTLRVLNAEGVDVLLYETDEVRQRVGASGV